MKVDLHQFALRALPISHCLYLAFCLHVFAPAICSQSRSIQQRNLPEQSDQIVVKVKPGETLKSLAQQHGVTVIDLAERNNLRINSTLRKGQHLVIPTTSSPKLAGVEAGEVSGARITFTDGRTLDVDEAWKLADATWYRKGKVTQMLNQPVRSIDPILATKVITNNNLVPEATAQQPTTTGTWIYLVGGQRFKVDRVDETGAGAWYSRGNLSVFVEKERITRISHEDPSTVPTDRNRDWSSGSDRIDELIRTNGARYKVDPYFIFCVIEHESHFNPRAVSPKGARGLMQLMPGTARRFGVSRPFDVAENIKGGTRYLRELIDMFDGEINLVLASYNAGEGAVLKYGRQVPPYQETREYVRRIGKHYGVTGRRLNQENQIPSPQR